MKSTFLFAIIVLASTSVFAETHKVYRWVDAEGATHYSQTPPPGRSAEEVSVPIGPATAAPAPSGAPQQAPSAPAQPGPAGNQARQAAERQAIGEEVCGKLRDYLSKLQQTSRRIYERDKAGNIHWLTDEDRQQRIADTQKQLGEFCEPAGGGSKP
jgi:hypothetical protein